MWLWCILLRVSALRAVFVPPDSDPNSGDLNLIGRTDQARNLRFSPRNLGQEILFHSVLSEQLKKRERKKHWCFGVSVFQVPRMLKNRKSQSEKKMEADVDTKAAWVTHGFSQSFASCVLWVALVSKYSLFLFFFFLKYLKQVSDIDN